MDMKLELVPIPVADVDRDGEGGMIAEAANGVADVLRTAFEPPGPADVAACVPRWL